MFICQSCHTVTQPGAAPNRIVTERRTKTYTNYIVGEKGKLLFGKQGQGWEIAREIIVCAECYKLTDGVKYGD